MAEKKPQTYANHAKLVPMYHYVAGLIVITNLGVALYQAATNFSLSSAFHALVAFAFVVVALFARVFALGAQDRVIRLEERMRMQEVLPDDLKSRIDDITTPQLIALRFAPDEELADLTRKALDGELADQKAIKQAITTWRPDYQRL